MPWAVYPVPAVGHTPGSLFTQNNPAPLATPANTRSWKPAVPTALAPPIGAALTSELALRGDHRTPNQVDQAGGLWSHLFRNPDAGDHGALRYDPDRHQAGPGQAQYVSFTRDIAVAKGFAGPTGYVYLARINVGVDYNQYRGGNAMQAEVMALHGVALRDILAARSMATNQILLNLSFQPAGMTPATFNAAIALLSG
ncbi:MAG: hypothetical protein IRZ00_06610 [Gemmatimonadetes bacterium]|nr:hypothetical protein [Gemmatimonadota bacterium]